MDPEQLQLLLEGFEAAAVIDEPGQDAALIVKETKAKKPSKRMFFPDDLPEEVLEFDLPESERTCPQTGAERRFIRWEESIKKSTSSPATSSASSSAARCVRFPSPRRRPVSCRWKLPWSPHPYPPNIASSPERSPPPDCSPC